MKFDIYYSYMGIINIHTDKKMQEMEKEYIAYYTLNCHISFYPLDFNNYLDYIDNLCMEYKRRYSDSHLEYFERYKLEIICSLSYISP